MVSLEVGIDAAGVVSGGAQASSALSGIAQMAALASTSLAGSSAAAAGFGAALTTAMPWITAIGAALSGITTGLLLFTSRTNDAATAWARFGDEMNKAQAGMQAAGMLGVSQQPFAQARQKQQFAALQKSIDDGGPVPFGELEATVGGLIGRSDMLSMIATHGGPRQLMEFASMGRFSRPRTGAFGAPTFSEDPSGVMVPAEVVQAVLQQSYQRAGIDVFDTRSQSGGPTVQGQAGSPYLYGGAGDIFGTPDDVTSTGMLDVFGKYNRRQQGRNLVSQSLEERFAIDVDIGNRDRAAAKKAASDEAQKAADRLLDTAMQISDTFADGVTNLAFGLTSAREVAAGMLYDLARGLSRKAMGELTNSIVNSFGSTNNH